MSGSNERSAEELASNELFEKFNFEGTHNCFLFRSLTFYWPSLPTYPRPTYHRCTALHSREVAGRDWSGDSIRAILVGKSDHLRNYVAETHTQRLLLLLSLSVTLAPRGAARDA